VDNKADAPPSLVCHGGRFAFGALGSGTEGAT